MKIMTITTKMASKESGVKQVMNRSGVEGSGGVDGCVVSLALVMVR